MSDTKITLRTRFEQATWDSFESFTRALTKNGFADTCETAVVAASLTLATATREAADMIASELPSAGRGI